MKIEVTKYLHTPGAKFLGLADVLLDEKILLRFKIVEGKGGKGSYPVAASYCVETTEGNIFYPAFMIDSRIIQEEIDSQIRKKIAATKGTPKAKVSHEPEPDDQIPF